MPDPRVIDVDKIFTYHAPKNDQAERCERIREAAKHLAEVILEATPPGADQSAAIRHVRDAVDDGERGDRHRRG